MTRGWGQISDSIGRWRRSSRGATLIEFSLIFPIMILLVIAILELGMLFKDFLTISALSREGARIGALAGDSPEADCAILLGLETLATPTDLARMTDGTNQVEIFRASVNGGVVTGPNTADYEGGGPAKCSVPAEVDDTWTYNSSPWPPSSRNTEVGQGVSPDILGVRIQVTHQWITGFPPFRGSVQIDETTITRIEPEVFFPQP
jgi:Flp pilus assembly protein TadG